MKKNLFHTILPLALAACGVLLLSGCSGASGSSDENTLNVYNWGEYIV